MSLDITRVALPKGILDKDAKESETDMKQEMLRFNRWKRTVSKIEKAFSDGVPKVRHYERIFLFFHAFVCSACAGAVLEQMQHWFGYGDLFLCCRHSRSATVVHSP